MRLGQKKGKKLRGQVTFIPHLGWCLLITSRSDKRDDGFKTPPKRRYYLVDWSKVNPPGPPGLWEAITGDFTERYHDDWVRPTKLIKSDEEE